VLGLLAASGACLLILLFVYDGLHWWNLAAYAAGVLAWVLSPRAAVRLGGLRRTIVVRVSAAAVAVGLGFLLLDAIEVVLLLV
jgi:hypothetical protein